MHLGVPAYLPLGFGQNNGKEKYLQIGENTIQVRLYFIG